MPRKERRPQGPLDHSARPLRVGFYARVSTEEQTEGYSLDAQVRAGRLYAEGREAEFIPYVEEGKSARTEDVRKRPVFRQLLEDALEHRIDAIVVHKLDRFSRNLRVLLDSLDKLGNAGVSFASLTEQIDYSTPSGRLFLTMLGGLAQWYSDNLSFETKKGKAERKAQGLYNGLLPFGVKKGPDGVPVADLEPFSVDGHVTTNHAGLVLAFQRAATGESDLEVARTLNAAGYRTTGNRGSNPFTKSTVCVILQNRFYLGELPDGNGGWVTGKHQEVLDPDLFQATQEARMRNNTNRRTVRRDAELCSLSGLGHCARCGGKIRAQRTRDGRIRLNCATRLETRDCDQPGCLLGVYEEQLERYLAGFTLPDDYQQRILDMYRQLQSAAEDAPQHRARIESRLERIKELYSWGDYSRDKYLAEKAELEAELSTLRPVKADAEMIERLASFLRDISLAWREAAQPQRNRLLKQLVEEVWIDGDRVVGVKARAEFEPFFKLHYELTWPDDNGGGAKSNTPADKVSTGVLHLRKRRDSRQHLQERAVHRIEELVA